MNLRTVPALLALLLAATVGVHCLLFVALAVVALTLGALTWLILGVVAESGLRTRPVRYRLVRA
jgi:hypothetical protein